MTNTIDRSGPWVDVVFLDGYGYDELMAETNDNATGSDNTIERAVDYMSRWDYGTDTDAAHTTDGAQWGPDDTVHTLTRDGVEYVYATNHYLGYASLNRRPLTVES